MLKLDYFFINACTKACLRAVSKMKPITCMAKKHINSKNILPGYFLNHCKINYLLYSSIQGPPDL